MTAYASLGTRTVMRVGYGAMQLEHTDSETATQVLRKAVELGVDHIDTAEFYGHGTSNRAIRAALHPYSDDLQIVTKVGAVRVENGLSTAQQPKELRAAVEANLATLGAERIAVVNLRRADVPPGIISAGDQIVDLDSQLAELIALRDEGKIGGIGLSHVSLEQVRQAEPAGIVCVQNYYNMISRAQEPVMLECERLGIAWVPFFPLGSAFDHQPKVTDSPVVIEHAARLGITPAQAGLAWLLAHGATTLLIPGTRSLAHLVENVAVAGIELDDAALAAFDALAPVD